MKRRTLLTRAAAGALTATGVAAVGATGAAADVEADQPDCFYECYSDCVDAGQDCCAWDDYGC